MEVTIDVTDNDKTTAWILESDLEGNQTEEQFKNFIKNSTWMIAEEALKNEQVKGFDKEPRVRTDNKWNKEPRNVKFLGKIEYFSRVNIGDALKESYKMIEERSPVMSGQYRASHYVFVNQKTIATSRGELYVWLQANEGTLKDGDVVRILNVMPYASRIEIRGRSRGTRGKTKGKTINRMKNSFGSGVYALAARAIRGRFKSAAGVKFEMLPNGHGGIAVQPTGRFRTSYVNDEIRGKRKKWKRNRFEGPYVYPSIKFIISGEGITQ